MGKLRHREVKGALKKKTFLRATWVLSPLSQQERLAFVTVICPPNSSFRTRGQQQVFSKSIITFSVITGWKGPLLVKPEMQVSETWNANGRLDSRGWNGSDCVGHGLGGERMRRCPGMETWFPLSTWAGPATLGAACALWMDYLTLA